MSETSRRKFMAAAGVTAAAAGTVAISSGAANAATRAGAAKEPVMAVLDDHKSGVIRLLVGEREVVVTDKDLATRILNAAGGK